MPGSAKPRKLYKPQSKAGHQPLPRSVCTEFEGDLRFGLMALEHAASHGAWFISAEQARCIYEGINVLVDRLPSFTAAQICVANTEVREQRHKERAAA